MATKQEAQRAIRKAFGAKQDALPAWPAYLGNEDGTVTGSQADKVFVRYPSIDSAAVEVYNLGVPEVAGLRVMVGSRPENPTKIGALGVADVRTDTSVTTLYGTLRNHAAQHTRGTGSDPVYIRFAQTTDLGVYLSSGLVVQIFPGEIQRAGTITEIPLTTLDLTSHLPSTVFEGRWVLITLDAAGAITATDGDIVSDYSAITRADIPATPAGHFRLAAVRCYNGQTAISDLSDILDLRWPQEKIAGILDTTQIEPGSAQYQYLTTGATPFTPAWSSGLLNIAGGKTLTANNTLTLAGGADGYTLTVPATGTAALGTGAANTVAYWSGTNTLTTLANGAGVLTNDGAGGLSWTAAGSGTVTGTGTTGRVTQWNNGAGGVLEDSTLIKSGAGVLTLSAANTQTLTVTTGGTLTLGGYEVKLAGASILFNGAEAGYKSFVISDMGSYAQLDITDESTHTFSVRGNNTGDQTIPTAANPTASVGLSAANGSAATFMRSDAAPPLDVSIAPTWSGAHTFNNTTDSTTTATGAIKTSGGVGIAKNLTLPATSGTNGYGLKFDAGANGLVASFQGLDSAGASFLFYSTNRYFDGTNWQQLNTRVGGSLHVAADALKFYTFPVSSSTPTLRFQVDSAGGLQASGGFGCNTKTAQTAYASGGAAPAGGTGATAGAYDTAAHRDALITLVNNIRTALVNNGIMS